ncbi:RHS repeat-associated core domain-containing protein, partial [Kitasatospora indigofera]
HYGDDSDEVRWTVEDTTQGTLTRNVSGPDADLAATTSRTGDIQLQLTNLFGSVVITTDTALTTPVVLDFDEFGIPQDGQAQVRYGWLGGKQRSAEAQDGDILMGARLYSPALGRFLQIDPVPGGNASPYDYCTGDPVNCTDLDGNWGMPKWLKKTVQIVAVVAEIASNIPGPIGAAAAAVSAVSYAATGNWAKAAEMAVTAVAQTVGAGPVVKATASVVKSVRAASKAAKVPTLAKTVFRAASTGIRNISKSRYIEPAAKRTSTFHPENFGSRAEAVAAAQNDARLAGSRARYRGECANQNPKKLHVHVDYIDWRGKVGQTVHYRYIKKDPVKVTTVRRHGSAKTR